MESITKTKEGFLVEFLLSEEELKRVQVNGHKMGDINANARNADVVAYMRKAILKDYTQGVSVEIPDTQLADIKAKLATAFAMTDIGSPEGIVQAVEYIMNKCILNKVK